MMLLEQAIITHPTKKQVHLLHLQFLILAIPFNPPWILPSFFRFFSFFSLQLYAFVQRIPNVITVSWFYHSLFLFLFSLYSWILAFLGSFSLNCSLSVPLPQELALTISLFYLIKDLLQLVVWLLRDVSSNSSWCKIEVFVHCDYSLDGYSNSNDWHTRRWR